MPQEDANVRRSDLERRGILLELVKPPRIKFQAALPSGRFEHVSLLKGTIGEVVTQRARNGQPVARAIVGIWGRVKQGAHTTSVLSLRALDPAKSLDELVGGTLYVAISLENFRPRSRREKQLGAGPRRDFGVARASLILPWVRDFNEARRAPDGYFDMRGDWGGEQYLMGPMSLVQCSEEEFRQLHADLERILGEEPDGRELGFSSRGMDDAASLRHSDYPEALVIDEVLVEIGLDDAIREVLAGKRSRLGSELELGRWAEMAKAAWKRRYSSPEHREGVDRRA